MSNLLVAASESVSIVRGLRIVPAIPEFQDGRRAASTRAINRRLGLRGWCFGCAARRRFWV